MSAFLLFLALQAQDIDRLIRDLGDDDLAVRDSASTKLVEAGAAAEEALQRATSSPDPEVAARAKEALRRIQLNRRTAAVRARLPAKLLEEVPEILEPLASGTEEDLLQVIRLTRGIAVKNLTPDLATIDYVGAQYDIPLARLDEPFRIIWERVEAARQAGTPMRRLEFLYLAALHFSSKSPDEATVSAGWLRAPVPTSRLLKVYLAPGAPAPERMTETSGILELLLERHPPFEAPDMVAGLLEDPACVNKALAAQAAASIGLRGAIPTLREMLGGADPETSGAAADALARMGDTASIPKILEVLSRKKNAPRNPLRDPFKALVDLEAFDHLDAMADAIDVSPPGTRSSLISLFLQMRADAAPEQIAAWLEGMSPDQQVSVLLAVGSQRRKAFQTQIRELAANPPAGNRTALASMLIETGQGDRALDLLEGSQSFERSQLFQRLVESDVAGAEELLIRELETPDLNFVRSLCRLKAVGAADRLAELADDPDDQMAAAAIDAMCRTRGDAFERRLPGWLASERVFVRRAAVWGAAQRGTPVPLEVVTPLLGEKNGRYAARVALQKLFPQEGRELLRQEAERDWKETEPASRYNAALLMAPIDEARAAGWMRELAGLELKPDEDWMAADVAGWLAKRGDPKAVEMLERERVPSWSRESIADALARARHPLGIRLTYRSMVGGEGAPFELNAAASPEAWDRYKKMAVPADAPPEPTVEELAGWLTQRGVPMRWHPGVRPPFKADRVRTDAPSVLELLERIHGLNLGTRIRLEPDGTAVLQTTLTARRAWFDWWERNAR
jgi:hypothetical protein